MKRRQSTISLILSVLVACSILTAPASAETIPEEADLYGEYLAGSYANYIDDAQSRFSYFSRAYERKQDDTRLGRLALVSALQAGEDQAARKIASKLYSADKTESMARATLGIEAFAKGRANRAEKYLNASTSDLTASILMSLVRGWNEVDQGKFDQARETFTLIGGHRYFKKFGQLQVAKLELAQENFEPADEALKIVEEAGISNVEAVLTRAQWHIAQGDREAAIAGLQAFANDNIAAVAGPTASMLADLQAGKDIDINLSVRQQAARALTDPAFPFFVANRSNDGGELFLRFARQIDPDYGKSKIWLGSLLEDTERKDEALELYNSFDQSSDYVVSAKLSIANIYFTRDKDDEAIEILEKVADQHPSFITREALGRARFFRENYEEALPFYNAVVESMTEEDIKKNIEPLRLRGIIYERIGQWDKAEADFKRVLDIEPDNVDTLNYLGYTWVDRGENLTEAFDMIRKAVEKEPTSGAIVDSLGWAHYKLGQYKEAKEKLEEAVVLSPSSATIIDHLGDVYWKLGRKREAGYQWERALEFDPTDAERATIQLKLKGGLEAVSNTVQ